MSDFFKEPKEIFADDRGLVFDDRSLIAMDDGEYADYDDYFNDQIIHRGPVEDYDRSSEYDTKVGGAPLNRKDSFGRFHYENFRDKDEGYFKEVRLPRKFGDGPGIDDYSDVICFGFIALFLVLAFLFGKKNLDGRS